MKIVTRVLACVAFATTVLLGSSALGAGTAGAMPLPALPALPPLPEPFASWFTPPEPPSKKLTKSFAALQKSMRKSLPGQVGVAIVPIGTEEVISLGSLKSGRAWSTIKVPVALAAQRAHGVAVYEKEDKAITISDNDAAGELWGSLGGGQSSVDAVTAVLHEAHDTRTHVSSEADAPPSYPGHTSWTLRDQAIFGAHLPCLPDSEHLVRLMSDVAPNQQWGIAKVGREQGAVTAVKGGWGPVSNRSAGHLVRQLGIINTTSGQVAVSMAAVPRNGSFTTGTKMLTRMGTWLAKNLAQLPKGRC